MYFFACVIIISYYNYNRPSACLQSLEHWDRGFESRSMHGCVSAFFCVMLSFVGSGLATGCSPVQGVSPNVQK